jgi:hypothetical protein
MNGIFWEVQPTDKGKELSWWHFLFNKIVPASVVELKMGLTIQLTDAISAVLTISKTIDPLCESVIKNRKGLLSPNFDIHIHSKKFEVSAQKIFAGGSSRERVFNYRITLWVNSPSSEIIKLFQKSYHELGPKPLRETVVLE